MIPVRNICPLGCQCEEVKDDAILRCTGYVKLAGKDPQSEQEIDEWRCVLGWIPILLIEIAQMNRGVSAAICSTRDEVTKRQDVFNLLAANSIKGRSQKVIPK